MKMTESSPSQREPEYNTGSGLDRWLQKSHSTDEETEAEEWISEPEDRLVETTAAEQNKE